MDPYYIFTIKGISAMKLWKHYIVEFCASLYIPIMRHEILK